MRDAARILPLCIRLAHAWMRHPDLRLGQIISNVMKADNSARQPNLFYIEDEELVEEVERYMREFTTPDYKIKLNKS